ncbi:type II secretion system F family protein [Leifsonia sp. F6_8S_P_1B]|uniref:Type II secretion system F family protein n=1 Tax=Leifsonia williamsii TaxID=3035919 RepID=A0ABT8KA33_9MICO|nr:type II secretion system F family protein [Leifsonia williamsii]MDN4614315.1 type II secretion system F family protein [Leifsonia williamsii]
MSLHRALSPATPPGGSGRRGSGGSRRADGLSARAAIADVLAETAEGLAVLLDAGVGPASSWRLVLEDAHLPALRRVAARIADGSQPASALAAAQGPDARLLAPLAAVWLVAIEAGAALAPSLHGVASALHDRADALREVEVALSNPRSTARLVGWLPAVGLAMGSALGVDVLGALTRSPLGVVVLLVGVGLTAAGRLWTRALVGRSSRDVRLPGEVPDLVAIGLGAGLSVSASRRLAVESLRRLGRPEPDDPSIDRVLHLAERAGAPAADLLRSAARRERRTARARARAEAATLGVRLMMPLAVCVLPAFLLLGVAPVVLALLSSTGGLIT